MNLIKKSRNVLEKIGNRFGIDYAVIFGSAAREALNLESDLDFGIKFKKLPSRSKTLLGHLVKIKKILEKELGKDVDIVILNKANLGLRYEIFSTGKTIFISNEKKFREEKTSVIEQYLDFKYYIQRHWEEKVERLFYGQ